MSKASFDTDDECGYGRMADQRNDQPALGNHGHHHPFQQVALDGFDLYFQFGLDGQDVAFDSQDVGLGGQVAVEQLDLLICKGLSLFLRKAAGRQVLDKPVSIKGNRFAHEVIIGDEVSACKTLYEFDIPHTHGLDGHSDAKTMLSRMLWCDALLVPSLTAWESNARVLIFFRFLPPLAPSPSPLPHSGERESKKTSLFNCCPVSLLFESSDRKGRAEGRVGIGYDIHQLKEGRPLILGGPFRILTWMAIPMRSSHACGV